MLMHAFDSIVPHISSLLTDKGSIIHVNDHVRVKLRKDAFDSFSPSPGNLVFVDGGNGEILKGPNVSLQFCRLAASRYEGRRRVWRESVDFFVAVVAKRRDLDLVYDAQVFDLEGRQLASFSVDSLDPSLRSGDHRVSADAVANHVRKVEELRFAKEILKRLGKGDVLVRDGDLLSSGPFLKDELRRFSLASEKLGVHVIGLSKTCHLCTDAGASAVSAVRALAPGGSWFYFADGIVGFVRLHENSRYVFRFDVFPHDHSVLKQIFGYLSFISADPVFLGYPYGLVEVDKSARVSEHELRSLRTRFSLASKGSFDLLEAAVDAHDLLNTL